MNLDLIILGCKNKSINDQKLLFDYTYQELFNVSLRYTNSQCDADDVFNQSMLKVFKYIIESSSKLENYLGFCAKIIRLTAIDHYRSNISPIIYNSSLGFEKDDHGFFDEALSSLEVEDILNLIQKLPHKERLVFSMFEIDGFSHREISIEVGVNENHSKWLLHNAKKILKNKLIILSNKAITR